MYKGNLTVLTGGLGNQLFQAAKGMSLSVDGQIRVENSLGNPRLNSQQLPELMAYANNFLVFEHPKKTDHLANKIYNFALRYGVKAIENRPRMLLLPLIEFTCSVAFLLLRRRFIKFLIARGVGFDSREASTNCLLVGYFQSYRWLEKKDIFENFKKMKVQDPGLELLNLKKMASKVKPLVVHCRFGDYKYESNFGIPDTKYYEEAINYLYKLKNFPEIWVFSDEIELAKKNIPRNFLNRVRWIESVDDSSVSLLDAMRLGHGYVIANSTLSWWAAMLSNNSNAPVVAPKKWFKGARDPIDLVPDSWVRIDPW